MLKPTAGQPFRRVTPLLLILTGLFVLVWKMPLLPAWMGTSVMSLSMHIFAETFSIIIAALVFGVAYTSCAERPLPMVFLGCALLATGILDFGHMLSFKGMPAFVTPSDREKGLNFWLAARLLFACSMVAFPLLPWRWANGESRIRYWILTGFLLLVAVIFWLGLYHQQLWPRTYVVGQGLTRFKIGAEFTAIAIMLLAASLFFRKASNLSTPYDAVSLFAALIITCLSELTFVVYADVTDIFNLLGHTYKIVAYGFIYKAVFVVSVREPFLLLREANAKINLARKQYESMAALSPVGIFRTDAAGGCLYVNERWQELAGLTFLEALGDGWATALHPEDRQRVVETWEQVARGQQKFKEEYRFARPDGRIAWVLGQAKAEVDDTGRFIGYVGTVTDITERREAETRLRLILDGLDSLVYVADMGTHELLFMNKYGRDRWGEQAGKKCWQALQTGQDGPCSFCTNDRLVSGDGAPTGVHAWEFQNTVDGHWYDCRDQAIRWHDGRLVRMEIATDITHRKETEAALVTAREDWERIFSAIGDIATIQDTDHRILKANRRAGEVFGVRPEELEGRLCYEVFHGDTAFCEGCPSVSVSRDFLAHSAEINDHRLGKTFMVSASPVCAPNGELLRIVHIARDITEKKALEKQLRQAQKMEAVGTLAGGIAHDFNNILTPVLGYAEIIAGSLPVDSPMLEPAREVLRAGRRARDLVKQILSFSRQTEQERHPIQIHLVLKEALKLLRSSIPTTIEIKQNIATDALVLADPTMIHQVVMNLCTNAYHAMRESGGILAVCLETVEIDAEDYVTELHLRPGSYLRMEVSDTGCGMPQHLLERIFEPYFTTKEKGEGTGLGLSVVHGVITQLGGHITVYSELGKGTTFHVYLPKYVEKHVPVQPVATYALLPKGHEHILVVDDEKVIVDLMRQTMESLGYRVTVCIDSRLALEQFEAHPADFDLVMTDMTMPHLTGAELAQQLLAIRPDLPVVLCTGFSEIINEEKAMALGIRRLLMKPVLREELARVLREVFDTHKG